MHLFYYCYGKAIIHIAVVLPQAAAEAEPATMSMVRRAIPDASSLDEANQIVRGNWLQAIENHHLQYSGNSTIGDILDIGCSVGVSTKFLADKFPSAKVTVCLDYKCFLAESLIGNSLV